MVSSQRNVFMVNESLNRIAAPAMAHKLDFSGDWQRVARMSV